MTTPAIELRGVNKSFRDPGGGTVHAVRDVHLTIQPGEVVAFLGPNGAGKTTTLDMVLGLTNPTSGEVHTLGMAPRDAIGAGKASAVLQTGGLLRDLSVRETVTMIASTYRGQVRSVDDVLTRAGIAKLADRKVSKCSGGEQQRIRFALALIPDPELLVLDEPTAGMDVGARHEFWDTMKQEATQGRAVVFATHYLQEAEDFAQRIVLMASGSIVADGATDEVRGLAGGRHLNFVVPDGQETLVRDALRQAFPDLAVETQNNRLEVRTPDADQAARFLLTRTPATDLIITRPSLDEAFVSITEGEQR